MKDKRMKAWEDAQEALTKLTVTTKERGEKEPFVLTYENPPFIYHNIVFARENAILNDVSEHWSQKRIENIKQTFTAQGYAVEEAYDLYKNTVDFGFRKEKLGIAVRVATEIIANSSTKEIIDMVASHVKAQEYKACYFTYEELHHLYMYTMMRSDLTSGTGVYQDTPLKTVTMGEFADCMRASGAAKDVNFVVGALIVEYIDNKYMRLHRIVGTLDTTERGEVTKAARLADGTMIRGNAYCIRVEAEPNKPMRHFERITKLNIGEINKAFKKGYVI